MEIFSHINELGDAGWSSIRTLVVASPCVTLWGPSISYLDELRRQNPTLPSSDELLWYVDQGHIRIICREWWLKNDHQRQNHGWEHARSWTDFDQRILHMWKDDQQHGRTGTSARVIAVSEEDGREWAHRYMQETNVDINRFHQRASQLLPGYMEKASRVSTLQEAVASLIRDAKNHGDAFRASGADRNLGSPNEELLTEVMLESIASEPVHNVTYVDTAADPERLLAAVHSVLEKVRSASRTAQTSEHAFEATQELLSDEAELTKMRYWLTESDRLASGIADDYLAEDIAMRLTRMIQEHSPRLRWSDYILPRSPIQIFASVAGIALGAIGLIGFGSVTAPFSLGLLALRPIETTLKRFGIVREDYTGPRWPFYICDGSAVPRRTTREAILRAIAPSTKNCSA